MFVKLSAGEARIMVAHTTIKSHKREQRATIVKLAINDEVFEVKAVCSLEDNFSKKVGRRYAAMKLLERCRYPQDYNDSFLAKLTKNDRATIFKAICPNYFPATPKEKQNVA